MYSAPGVLLPLATDVLLQGLNMSLPIQISCLGKMLESISLCGMKILLDKPQANEGFPCFQPAARERSSTELLNIFLNIVAIKNC